MKLEREHKRQATREIAVAVWNQGYRADDCCGMILRYGIQCALDAYDGRKSFESMLGIAKREALERCSRDGWFQYHYMNLGGEHGGTQFAKEAFFMGVNAGLAWADNKRRKHNVREPSAEVL